MTHTAGMELYQLRTFVTIAREGNLTRASERLFTSQPAISAQVKALEEELRVKLFDRTSKGMRLTDSGAILLDEAEKALAAASGVLAQARQLQGNLSGELRLGTVTDPVSLRLGEFISRLAATHPGLGIKLKFGISGAVIADVRARELDAAYAVGELEDKGLHVVRLRPLRLVIVAPAAWRARVEGADWGAMAKLPWIGAPEVCSFHQIARDLFARNGIALRNFAAEADQENTMRSLVAGGVGAALLREDQALDAVAAGEAVVWQPGEVTSWLNFICLEERRADPLIEAASAALEAVWPAKDRR